MINVEDLVIMISAFDFILFGCIAVVDSVLIEFIKKVWNVQDFDSKKWLAIIVSAISAVFVIVYKSIFITAPTWDVQWWAMQVLYVLCSVIASQLTYDYVVEQIKKLIVDKK